MFFGNIFLELLAFLGSVIVFGMIIVASAFVIFVTASIVFGLIRGFIKSNKKE